MAAKLAGCKEIDRKNFLHFRIRLPQKGLVVIQDASCIAKNIDISQPVKKGRQLIRHI